MTNRILAIAVAFLIATLITNAADSTKAGTAIFQNPVTTKRAVTIGGKRVEYEATAGHLTLV
jgi:hypothetical protein